MDAQYIRLVLFVIAGLVVLFLVVDSLSRRRRKSFLPLENEMLDPLLSELNDIEDPNLGPVRVITEPLEKKAVLEKSAIKITKPLSSERLPRQETFRRQTSVVGPSKKSAPEFSDQILVINVTAPKDKPFQGYEMLQAILAEGFRFGSKQLFHRHKDQQGLGTVLFSLASATSEGTFNIEQIDGFSCRGLTLFMHLPASTGGGMAVLDLMLNAARALAETLQGEVRDSRLQILSDSSIEAYKQQIRESEKGQMALELI